MPTLDATESLLARLTNANGAPGFETPVRDILRHEWNDLLVDVRTDGLGNLTGRLVGTPDSPRLLFTAHMDEVAFLVDYIDDDGFVYILPVGGHFPAGVLMHRFTIATARGEITAYAGHKSTHAVPADERTRVPATDDIFLDAGVRSREEAERLGIRSGLPVTYRTELEVLNGTRRYLAKAFDDRAALAALTEALRLSVSRERAAAVFVAGTVQEEVGMRGAAVLADSIRPDVVINLEVSIAGDFPQERSPRRSRIALGRGPSLFVYDGSMIPNNNLVEWILALARDSGIPLQLESLAAYAQDGSRLQTSGRGVAAVNLGLPVRYAHTASGVLDRDDYDALVQLLSAIIGAFDTLVLERVQRF